MQKNAEKMQDKIAVLQNSSTRGRTSEEHSEVIPLQHNILAGQNTGLFFDDFRIHYRMPMHGESMEKGRIRTPVIQRYSNVTIESGLDGNEQPITDFKENDKLYEEVTNGQLSPDYFDTIFAYILNLYNLRLSKERYHASVRNNSRKSISFGFDVEDNDVKRVQEINNTKWIQMPDYASGDQFTIAALLLHDPTYGLLIRQVRSNYESIQKLIIKTFEITLGNEAEDIYGFHVIKKDGRLRVVYQEENRSYPGISENKWYQPKEATKQVGKEYKKDELGANLREQWSVPKEAKSWKEDPQWVEEGKKILDWAQGIIDPKEVSRAVGASSSQAADSMQKLFDKNKDNLSDKDIVVLWLRHSGAKGGAHLEHDTGTTAMEQLIGELLKNPKVIVILVGDRLLKTKNSRDKELTASQVQRLINVKTSNGPRVFDFTEFWKRNDDLSGKSGRNSKPGTGSEKKDPLEEWGGNTRLGQTRFYDFLAAKAHSLRHIGSRSGNLELMALIGHRAIYIEEKNSYGGKRMQHFDASNELHYKRLLTERPLTIKGNLVRIINYLLQQDELIPLRSEFDFKIDFMNSEVIKIQQKIQQQIQGV